VGWGATATGAIVGGVRGESRFACCKRIYYYRFCMTPFKTAAVLAAALWTLVCGVDGTLDYSRVHIVDQNKETGNFLFRGNMPVNSSDNSFQYQTLVKYMGMRAEEANVTLPADFTLVDISLNNLFDKALKVEKAFWKNPANAKYGKFINWPLGLAGIVPPSKFSPSEQRKMANSTVWKIDKIPARITAIREMLETKTDKPTVVYVHCTAGCDRTGEVIGSYRLKYETEYNVTQMYALDVSECGRPPNYWSTTALEWFCIYEAENGRPALSSTCTGFAKCKFAGKCTPTTEQL
jgi:hypothetical protein